MSGDYSRFTDRPQRRYTGVRMQQGRVQLDADWNEQVALGKRRWETQALDTFGPCAVPAATTPDGFKVSLDGTDLELGDGRIYVHGRLAEIFEGEIVKEGILEHDVSYLHQPFYPDPPPLPQNPYVVYLDVWDREVTCIEDPDLLEKALLGPDTATRIQTVWQVKIHDTGSPTAPAECGAGVGEPASNGRLSTRAIAPPASDDPCILSPTGGYRGLENRLYRVEIHDSAGGTTRFKWSRENASVVSVVTGLTASGTESRIAIHRIGRDAVLRFQIDDWVEVTDDHRELMGEPGAMARVTVIDEATRTLTLDRDITTAGRPFGADGDALRDRHTRVRRWDQRDNVDGDGLLAVAGGWIPLEDGVEVSFSGGSLYHAADFWSFAARTVDGSVEELKEALPHGIVHFYCQLAAVNGQEVDDCRPLWPDCKCGCCCTIDVGDGQESHGDFDDLVQAVAALAKTDPNDTVVICLLPGIHRLPQTVVIDRSFVTVRGCGRAAQVIGPDQAPIFEVRAQHVRLEDLFLTAGPGRPAVVSKVSENLEIVGNEMRHDPGGKRGPAMESGLIVLETGTVAARVIDNELGPGESHGIALAKGFQQDIRIAGNDIRGLLGCGITSIESTVFFDEEEDIIIARLMASKPSARSGSSDLMMTAPPVPQRIDGLRIEHNTITGCVGVEAKTRKDGLPYGGIVLAQVDHLQISDNRIEANGAGQVVDISTPLLTVKRVNVPVAGIYVRSCRGLIVRDNVVVGNGPEPDGKRTQGPQGGILGEELSVVVEAEPDGWPAAAVHGNLVVAPRGLALGLHGLGPIQVTDNLFTSRDVSGDYGTVAVFSENLPNSAMGGKVQFSDNQAVLDLVRSEKESLFASVAIRSRGDLAFHDNQIECILAQDTQIDTNVDLWGTTVRASGNLFTESFMSFTFFSLVAQGAIACTVTDNQGTQGIDVFGPPQKVVDRDNITLN